MFYCGDDAGAKPIVAKIIEQFGWAGADMGTAKAARAIEPLCQLSCILGVQRNEWTATPSRS
jgi:predicted dinucleotide-binding enzyme